MLSLASPIPYICISPAPLEDPPTEPYSPFTSLSSAPPCPDSNFRSQHLTPPPTLSSFARNRSPLRHIQVRSPQGLERSRFEALLHASKERSGSKKEHDLRREIALKTHQNKQFERRALFLSKILAPPSPSATNTPKTPPDSPAVFHYSFPSPGMESPLSLFESLETGDFTTSEPWVEQVDFRLPEDQWISKKLKPKPRKLVPSLAEISARLNVSTSSSSPALSLVAEEPRQSSTRLPAFLRSVPQQASHVLAAPHTSRPSLVIDVESLLAPSDSGDSEIVTPHRCPLPESPGSPQMPKLQITTLVVPRTPSMSPVSLTKANLLTLSGTRERMSKDMLSALRRRTIISERSASPQSDGAEDRKSRRHSSPAELPLAERVGFEHPVLALPGGF